jgi:ABC-2 type transport system permease protein
MNAQRTLAVSRKVLRSLRHDKRTAGFLVLMPIFMIAIFGYTFGGQVKGVDVYVVNLDEGSLVGSFSDLTIAHLQEDQTLHIIEVKTKNSTSGDPLGEARAEVENGRAWAVIYFPENFTRDIAAYVIAPLPKPAPVQLTVLLDASNFNIAQAVQASVQQAMGNVLKQDMGLVSPVQMTTDMVYGGGLDFIDTFAPGVVSLAVMMVTFMLSIISFIHERSAGTLDRLLSTPLTEAEVVFGYALAFGLVGLIQSIVVLATAILLFGVVVEGSILLVLLIILLLGIGMQGLGFLLSANARNEFQAIQFIPLILFPSILLSGVFWPLQSVPEVLRPVSYVLPLTYAVDGVRSVMIRGWGLEQVGLDIGVLVFFALLMLLGSVLLMRRRK